jgi:hypothetical protein
MKSLRSSPLSSTSLQGLASFIKEMQPNDIHWAVAPGEDRAALQAALQDLVAAGGAVH